MAAGPPWGPREHEGRGLRQRRPPTAHLECTAGWAPTHAFPRPLPTAHDAVAKLLIDDGLERLPVVVDRLRGSGGGWGRLGEGTLMHRQAWVAQAVPPPLTPPPSTAPPACDTRAAPAPAPERNRASAGAASPRSPRRCGVGAGQGRAGPSLRHQRGGAAHLPGRRLRHVPPTLPPRDNRVLPQLRYRALQLAGGLGLELCLVEEELCDVCVGQPQFCACIQGVGGGRWSAAQIPVVTHTL